ncbi:MAG: hypothetical protein RLZZ609_285 [Cyanobacteriota bacterium]|jgi:hypothetical protein
MPLQEESTGSCKGYGSIGGREKEEFFYKALSPMPCNRAMDRGPAVGCTLAGAHTTENILQIPRNPFLQEGLSLYGLSNIFRQSILLPCPP